MNIADQAMATAVAGLLSLVALFCTSWFFIENLFWGVGIGFMILFLGLFNVCRLQKKSREKARS